MPVFFERDLLVYAQVGDLHVTVSGERNYRDFLSIAAQIETECASVLDFVFLPGDNADGGKAGQYRLIRTALKLLSPPVHVITGDHDMEQGSLDAFYGVLGVDPLPKAVTAGGTRCLFLDVSGPGSGGPDFRLDAAQFTWLGRELAAAGGAGLHKLLFIHTYPADLKGEGQAAALSRLVADHGVTLVAMGHTHYNEIANDGRTIFAATRSTGQIEEGPVGYSLAAVDGGVVSWRFKALDEAFPFVLITAPADRRLMRDDAAIASDGFEVRAVVLGAERVVRCDCRIEGEAWTAMARPEGDRRFQARLRGPKSVARFRLTVRVVDALGRPAQDTVEVAAGAVPPTARRRDGSDADAIGAWPERGILGTQLGPNRNGASAS